MPVPRQFRYYFRDNWYHELLGAPIAPASQHSTPLRVQFKDEPYSVCMFDYDVVNAAIGTDDTPFNVWALVARLAIGGVTAPDDEQGNPQRNAGRHVNSWTRFFAYSTTFPTGLSLFLVEAYISGLGSIFAPYNGAWLMQIQYAGGSGGTWGVHWYAPAHVIKADAYCFNHGSPDEEQYFKITLPALRTGERYGYMYNRIVFRRDDEWTDREYDHMMGSYYMWMDREGGGGYFEDPEVAAACAGATCEVRVPWGYI